MKTYEPDEEDIEHAAIETEHQLIHDTLEHIIDKQHHGLFQTIYDMAEIAREKAAHIRETWQDKSSADSWERDASMLERLARKLKN